MWQEIKMRILTQNLTDRWKEIQKTDKYVIGEMGAYIHDNSIIRRILFMWN